MTNSLEQAWTHTLRPRVVVIVDATTPQAVHDLSHAAAVDLAERAGVAVTLGTVQPCCLEDLGGRLARAPDSQSWKLLPSPPAASMSAAPFLWRPDGRPDWGSMWTTFCELALYGGPPHRGPDNPLRAPDGGKAGDTEMLAELQRGIWETTGLYAELAEPGWIAVTCESRRMAAWLCATIILENVEARVEEDRLLLPAGPGYRLKDEVKSVVTVLAKTHHYWQAHLAGG